MSGKKRVPSCDWSLSEDYQFTASLNGAQWAWQFLRRNAEYRSDWEWVWSTWQRLEQRYGKPPQRDFARWKLDPDAYREVDDAAGECRVDQDKVLIECWMGAKWGFYKFPIDPAVDNPLPGDELLWRPVQVTTPVVQSADSIYLEGRPERVALGFDLDAPLRAQLEQARGWLQRRRAKLRRDGSLRLRDVRRLAPEWCLMLRILDGLASGRQLSEVDARLAGAAAALGSGQSVASLCERAQDLVAGGYRMLQNVPG
jgi:hypothetical protein